MLLIDSFMKLGDGAQGELHLSFIRPPAARLSRCRHHRGEPRVKPIDDLIPVIRQGDLAPLCCGAPSPPLNRVPKRLSPLDLATRSGDNMVQIIENFEACGNDRLTNR